MRGVWPKQRGLPSLIYHEPVLEVRFVRGAAGTMRILTIRDRLEIADARVPHTRPVRA
jgi:hypothetical protein